MQWPKKPATCRRQAVDNKEFLCNSVNSFLVLIYLTVIKDTDIRSKKNGYIYVCMYTCMCAYVCTQDRFRNICTRLLSICVLLNLYGFNQLDITSRRIHTCCNALQETQYVLTEVNLHLRNFTESLTVMLLNFCAMKVKCKQSIYDKKIYEPLINFRQSSTLIISSYVDLYLPITNNEFCVSSSSDFLQ